MKSNKKITKLQLKDTREDEFIILGLVSTEPDYKLSLILNNKLRTSLKNIKPIMINDDRGEQSFSRFSSPAGTGIIYSLISNRSEKNFLLKKLKNIDFIFQVYDPENETSVESLSTALRETGAVTAIFTVDQNSLKDKNLHYLNQ